VAALIASANPFLSPAQLSALLKSSVRPFVNNPSFQACGSVSSGFVVSGVCNCDANVCGSGMLDANLALNQALIPMTRALPAQVQLGSTFQTPTQIISGGSTVLLRADSDASVVAGIAGSGPLRASWAQLSGPRGTITTPDAMNTTVSLSITAGTVVFELRLTDAAGRTKADQLSFLVAQGTVPVDPSNPPVNMPQPVSSGGGGAFGVWELLAVLLLGFVAFRATARKRPS
jgi:serine protease